MKLLILFALITFVTCAPMDSDENENCIENYLKKLELVTSEFGDDQGVSSGCNFMISIIKKEIYKQIDEELVKKGEDDHHDCLIRRKKLEERDFASTLLALSTYKETSKVDQSLKDEKIAEIQKTVEGQMILAAMDCKLEHQFNEMFEELIEGSTQSEEATSEEEFCARKYIVENELFDSSYKLKLNPEGIDTSSLNCQELFPAIRQQAEDELIESFLNSENSGEKTFNETSSACAVNVIKGENFFDRLLPFSFLHELDLKESEKENEKSKFVQVMKDFTEALITMCFL